MGFSSLFSPETGRGLTSGMARAAGKHEKKQRWVERLYSCVVVHVSFARQAEMRRWGAQSVEGKGRKRASSENGAGKE